MKKQNSFMGIAMSAFAILLLMTAQSAAAQPVVNTTGGGEVPKSVQMDLFDTRNNAKYTYVVPNDANLKTSLNSLLKGALAAGVVSSAPQALQNTAQDVIVNNVSSTVQSLYNPSTATGPTGFFSTIGKIVRTGVKVGTTVGPILALFGPGPDYR